MGRAMLNSSSCGCVVSKKAWLNSRTYHPVWRWSAILSKKTGLNSKDLPSSVEVVMVCYPQQEGRVELKGLTIQCGGGLLSSARIKTLGTYAAFVRHSPGTGGRWETSHWDSQGDPVDAGICGQRQATPSLSIYA